MNAFLEQFKVTGIESPVIIASISTNNTHRDCDNGNCGDCGNGHCGDGCGGSN